MALRISFFRYNILIIIYFFEYETIETHSRAFLPLNISAVGSVKPLYFSFVFVKKTIKKIYFIYFTVYINLKNKTN